MTLPDCVYRASMGESILCKKHGEQMIYEVAQGRCRCSEGTRKGWVQLCQPS
jgi:hypothetical protein